ncbi:MarR family transcriptional regulator [Salinibacterium sp. ZJ77]|uniref:MarR family winged helix-turn-helix transcriptional regulator n=1 Tax=Salinibacterium sp. ZJ77 TaxID=2708337 RepID=UPI001FBAE45B|nr:MarR family transcriptional regulator [Salinibacterium sp. ZJ77]
MTDSRPGGPEMLARINDPRVMDSASRIMSTGDMSSDDIADTVRVLDALAAWRNAELRMSEASRRFMKLGDNDMKALRFIIVTTDHGEIATAQGIAKYLGISSAATTKLLDRLEAGDHIKRLPHPTDRRARAIVVDELTRESASATIGREHARRFRVAAALTPEERDVIVRFLGELSKTTEGEWAEQKPFGSA